MCYLEVKVDVLYKVFILNITIEDLSSFIVKDEKVHHISFVTYSIDYQLKNDRSVKAPRTGSQTRGRDLFEGRQTSRKSRQIEKKDFLDHVAQNKGILQGILHQTGWQNSHKNKRF